MPIVALGVAKKKAPWSVGLPHGASLRVPGIIC
jgi:hypothetical protein